MTEPIDFLIDTPDGQRSITINPINITPTSGVLYVTGEYSLAEGSVGMGTITFTTEDSWTFDGITDILSADDIALIANFIKQQDSSPAGLVDDYQDLPFEPTAIIRPDTSQTLNFIVDDHGKPVDVRVVDNYPFYDVTVAGKNTAQLEQDHHSNWFVTQGQLTDSLVQAIGARITKEITGV